MTQIDGASKVALPSRAALWGVVLALAAGPVALAADKPQPAVRAPAVQAVVDCRKIEDSAQRLACYDGAVSRMEEAEAKGDLVTVDREQRQTARRQAFGFMLPSLSFLDRGEKPEDLDRITTKIDSAWRGADGKWRIKLEGGAVWRQIDSYEPHKAPRNGSTAAIRKASLGSFFMNIDGQQAIRVHRED